MTTLLIAAHGTRWAAGTATTLALRDAVALRRPDVPVALGFLDVASPSVAEVLDELAGTDVIVVPLLLSAGYHVTTDIPALVADCPSVRVARHLGPEPLLLDVVATRLTAVCDPGAVATVALAAIASSRSSARDEVDAAAGLLASRLGRPVEVLPLGADVTAQLASLPAPVAVASYLLAEGGFLDTLRAGGAAAVADPIGPDPALVDVVWSRWDEALDATR